jgi:predicted nucleic acid-binding protein
MDSRRQGAIGKTPKFYVVDASVVVKWVLSGEPYEENATKFKDNQLSENAEMFAPSLMIHEVANSLWKAIRLKRITLEDALRAMKDLDDLQINLQEQYWTEASSELAIANKFGITTYDAAYLSLSEKMNAPVITADDTMYEKAKGHFKVLHLRDYV